MSVIVVCPQCQRKLQVQDEFLGKQIRCPGCKTAFAAQRPAEAVASTIPKPSSQPVPKPAAAPSPSSSPTPISKTVPRPAADNKSKQVTPAVPKPKPPVVLEEVEDGPHEPRIAKTKPAKVPKKSRSVLKTFLIVGLVLLLSCGGLTLGLGYWAWVSVNSAYNDFRAQINGAIDEHNAKLDAETKAMVKDDSDPLKAPQEVVLIKPLAEAVSKETEEEIKAAAAKVKLVPVEITLSGVTITLMAPEKTATWSRGTSAGVADSDEEKFNLSIEQGHLDFPTAKEIWKNWPSEKLTGLPIDTSALVMREFTTLGGRIVEDGTHYRFVLNASFGHLDVHFTNAYNTREECLLMIHCARTAALKEPYTPPATLADLEKCGIHFQRRSGKIIEADVGKGILTDALLAVIARLLPDLEALDLRQTAITDKGLRTVAGMKNLHVLSLPSHHRFTQLSPVDEMLNGSSLAHLAGLTNLESLEIGDMLLSEDSLVHLKGLTNLDTLDMKRSRLTGTGFVHLAGLAKLETLYLTESQFSDAGVKQLAGLKKLKQLFLRETQVTGTGFVDFPGLPELEVLDLSETPFTDVGLQGLAGMPKLRSLNLVNTQVTGDGFAALKNLRGPVEIVLLAAPVNDEGLKQLAEVLAITSLNLEKTKITDAGVEHLKELKNIKELRLENTSVADTGLKHLAGLKSLTLLELSVTKVTDEGLKHLVGLQNLSILGLKQTWITDAGLEPLKALKKLSILDAEQTKVTKAGVAELKKTLPEVRVSIDKD